MHEWVLAGEIEEKTHRRESWFSNTLVLPGMNIYEALKIDDPKKLELRDYTFDLRGRHLEGAVLMRANLPKWTSRARISRKCRSIMPGFGVPGLMRRSFRAHRCEVWSSKAPTSAKPSFRARRSVRRSFRARRSAMYRSFKGNVRFVLRSLHGAGAAQGAGWRGRTSGSGSRRGSSFRRQYSTAAASERVAPRCSASGCLTPRGGASGCLVR